MHSTEGNSPATCLWAKWGPGGEQRYPLTYHLLDTAAAAAALLDVWVPGELTATLEQRSGLNAAQLAALITHAAGLHDIGKATPVFQGQRLSGRAADFDAHMTDLAQAGLADYRPRPSEQTGTGGRLLGRHEIASAVFVDEGRPTPSALGALVAGHHGSWRFLTSARRATHVNVDDYYLDGAATPEWAAARAAVAAEVEAAIGARPDCDVPVALVPVLTGLVSLADWLASSESALDSGRRWHPGGGCFSERIEWMRGHACRLLGVPERPAGSDVAVYGFELTAPAQVVLTQARPAGLSVVMAPMGDGKTEAALARWQRGEDRRGLYFALPTMASADAMFDRVQAFFSHSEHETMAALAHARSALNAFYSHAPDEAIIAEGSGGLVPGDWFSGRHRALLAPVAVGTVDQLLSGALKRRYNFMRLLAAATKTVVIDEVHSFDPYTSELLCAWLGWAGYLGVDVVLLSATLPRRRLAAYVNAYETGRTGTPPADQLTDAYPAVVTTDSATGTVSTQPIGTMRPPVTVRVDYRAAGGDDVAGTIADTYRQVRAAHPDAKVGVIVNQVATAQKVAAAIGDRTPLHSRLPASTRAARTAAAITRFGKKSRAGVDVIVATQILEQSVDVDFDYLITELSPAASLLQRTGRLWRHDRRSDRPRPRTLSGPQVTVVTGPAGRYGCLPYSQAEIAKTWAALDHGDRDTIHLPGDIAELVEAADVTLDDLAGELADAATEQIGAAAARVGAARRRRVPAPDALRRAGDLEHFSSGDGGIDETATRWDDQPQVTVICCSQHNGWSGPTVRPAAGRLTRSDLLDALGWSVPLSGGIAVTLLRAAERATRTVQQVPWDDRMLSGFLLVDLDQADSPLVCDPELGVMPAPSTGKKKKNSDG